MTDPVPKLRSVVLDTTDARSLAEFYKELLGYAYLPGGERPPEGEEDPNGSDWLVLVEPEGRVRLAFQQVGELRPATWPEGPVPQQVHLDLSVATAEELEAQHGRALSLGATLLLDRSDDPEERLYVYADPQGHPFCIFVVPQNLCRPPNLSVRDTSPADAWPRPGRGRKTGP